MIALLLTAAVAPITLLQPNGRWVVEYAQNMCVLSRTYGGASEPVTLGFRPYPMGASTEIVLLTPGSDIRVVGDNAELSLLPDDHPVQGTYNLYYVSKIKRRIATLSMGEDALKGLSAATAVSVRLGRQEAYTFALPSITAGLKALQVCQDDLLKGWGIDPAEREALSELPKANPAALFSADQYPPEAIRAGEQGRTVAVALVDASGAAKTCTVVESSGSHALDTATCKVLTRARFTPGKDKDGKPVPAHLVVPVRWVLPTS